MEHKLHNKRKEKLPTSVAPCSMFRASREGFTLVEMLVVISIFSVITLIVLVRHQAFNNTILLESLAYDIALTVREAQVYGTSVREESDAFDQSYGVFFTEENNKGSDTFLLFVDQDQDGKYATGETILEQITVGGGNTISDFCMKIGSGKVCASDGASSGVEMHITFQRPSPDALIIDNIDRVMDFGEIFVASPEGAERKITITATGVISVSKESS